MFCIEEMLLALDFSIDEIFELNDFTNRRTKDIWHHQRGPDIFQKLSDDDVQKFLSGYTVVADNYKNRATFQLTDNNTELKVIFLERDKNLSEILKQSKKKAQYTVTGKTKYTDPKEEEDKF